MTNLNDFFCANPEDPDCPALNEHNECTLLPDRVSLVKDTYSYYCYIGRQIMATRASLQQAREAFEKEKDEH